MIISVPVQPVYILYIQCWTPSVAYLRSAKIPKNRNPNPCHCTCPCLHISKVKIAQKCLGPYLPPFALVQCTLCPPALCVFGPASAPCNCFCQLTETNSIHSSLLHLIPPVATDLWPPVDQIRSDLWPQISRNSFAMFLQPSLSEPLDASAGTSPEAVGVGQCS